MATAEPERDALTDIEDKICYFERQQAIVHLNHFPLYVGAMCYLGLRVYVLHGLQIA